MNPKKTIIIGANGQLGRALQAIFPDADRVDRDTVDISSPNLEQALDWSQYDTLLNAAAYTAVDQAETDQGRIDSWLANAQAVANLAKIARRHDAILVHVSTDYVFDGTQNLHDETENFSPINVYGATKAAGDIAASLTPKHYILRTGWVIGDGKNFVLTMKSLAERGIKPSVVNDQVGRLTFTSDLADGIKHLLSTNAPYGTYNLTNDGEPTSWANIAKQVYELTGHDANDVTGVTTDDYYKDRTGVAPRPLQSTLNIAKIKSVGFYPQPWTTTLRDYLNHQEK